MVDCVLGKGLYLSALAKRSLDDKNNFHLFHMISDLVSV